MKKIDNNLMILGLGAGALFLFRDPVKDFLTGLSKTGTSTGAIAEDVSEVSDAAKNLAVNIFNAPETIAKKAAEAVKKSRSRKTTKNINSSIAKGRVNISDTGKALSLIKGDKLSLSSQKLISSKIGKLQQARTIDLRKSKYNTPQMKTQEIKKKSKVQLVKKAASSIIKTAYKGSVFSSVSKLFKK